MNEPVYARIDRFVKSTYEVIFLREADTLLMIRPNRIHHLNRTAFEMLSCLYHDKLGAAETVKLMAEKYSMAENLLLRDLSEIINTISALLNEDYASATMTAAIPFDPRSITLPVLSEIALTYRCQNRCDFCYASSPYRGKDEDEMTSGQVKTVIDKISGEAGVPTISFTGGEPTLRDDLPELISHASRRGMRVNLITNGIRVSDKNFVMELKEAGLNSAQVSLESADEEIHNNITGNRSAYKNVIQGIHNLSDAGIHTHTNTTICRGNRDHLIPLAAFIKSEFGFKYLSMNMIIATGIARDNENINIGYTTIGSIIKPVIKYCEENEIKFVWYSPTPYCVFNPVDHNLGAKSCACVSGLLSVNPSGEVLPCSSYDRGIGSLLKGSFKSLWNSDQAMYFRERRYIPPVCGSCELAPLCSGGCPLYWENAGGFGEIEECAGRKPRIRNLLWKIENRFRLSTRGISGLNK